ncbi:MAG: hypothetical protein ACRD88_08940, partial [Terriglobia bacterium]
MDSKGRVVFNNDPVPVPEPPPSAAASPNSLSDAPAYIHGLIEQTADYHQLDRDLIRAVVQVE